MKEHRVYSKKIDINTSNIQIFYDERAKKLKDMECPYTAVLLGDQDAKHARDWNIFEKEYILPQLEINKNNKVLDIGCGLGRWAETIIPISEYYCGTDFSAKMIEIAKSRNTFLNKEYDFFKFSFQEFVEQENASIGKKFDKVIIGGVCMYINDVDILNCFADLLNHLEYKCTMYLTETVAVKTRLTLDECPSQALKTNYDVIYRTPEEYNEYYKLFLAAGFEIIKQDYLPHLNSEAQFFETDRWYTILKRG